MKFDKYYTAPISSETVTDLLSRIEKAANILKKYEDDNKPNRIELDDLTELVYQLEVSAYSLRKSVESGVEINDISSENMKEFDEILFGNLPISARFDDQKLIISSPILLPNKRENRVNKQDVMRAFVLADYLEVQLKRMKNDTESYTKIQQKFIGKTVEVIAIQYRDKHTKQVNQGCVFRQAPVDLDNLEISRIINAVFSFLGLSDNPWNLTDLHLACRYEPETDRRGTEIYFIPTDSGKINTKNKYQQFIANTKELK